MIQKTKDYDIFKFRDDNKERIKQAHVNRLKNSIISRNLLQMRPIIVNEDYEILDGQHRLLAAKSLGVDIYYQVEKNMQPNDIITMNVAKQWLLTDYLNFYCVNKYPEYIKLKEFVLKNELSLKTIMNLSVGRSDAAVDDFKSGKFEFKNELIEKEVDICKSTISYIRKANGYSPYLDSGRFWQSLIKMIRHPDFDLYRWENNFKRLTDKFLPKSSVKEYLKTLQYVYNYKHTDRVRFQEEEY